MKFIVSRHGRLIFNCNLRFRMRNTTRQESRGSGGDKIKASRCEALMCMYSCYFSEGTFLFFGLT